MTWIRGNKPDGFYLPLISCLNDLIIGQARPIWNMFDWNARCLRDLFTMHGIAEIMTTKQIRGI